MSDSKGLSPFKKNILPVLLFLFGAISLYIGINEYRAAKASVHWLAVQGTITKASVEIDSSIDTSSGNKDNKIAVVEYSFTSAGKEYYGNRISFGHIDSGKFEDAEKAIMPYVNVESVDVYYDPENPKQSVLQPGDSGVPWFYILLGGTFILIGLGLRRLLKNM